MRAARDELVQLNAAAERVAVQQREEVNESSVFDNDCLSRIKLQFGNTIVIMFYILYTIEFATVSIAIDCPFSPL